MKAVDIELECQKNFGNTKAKLLFKLDANSKNDFLPIKHLIEGGIHEAQVVYICAENGISDDVSAFLENNNSLRIYILVRKINESVWLNIPYKENCIVREVPSLSGNYIITEGENSSLLFLFDTEFNGFVLKDSEMIHKMKQVFINEFWNYASKEFVIELQDVAEKSFDVPSVKGDCTLILNQGVEDKSPLQNIIDNVEEIFLRNNPEKFLNYPIKKLYLKNIPERTILESFLKNGTEVYYAPDLDFDFIKTPNALYAANFDISLDKWRESRDGRLFLLKTDISKFVYGKTYKLNESLTWNECLGNEILDINGKPYIVIEKGNLQEVKARPVDARKIKKNKKILANWEPYLMEQKAFVPNQRSIVIPFKITIPVLKKTLTKKALVYEQVEAANSAISKYYTNCLDEVSTKITRIETELNSVKMKLNGKDSQIHNEKMAREALDTNREEKIHEIDEQIKKIEQNPKILAKNKEIASVQEKINENKGKIAELHKNKNDKKAAGSIKDFEKAIESLNAKLQTNQDEKKSIANNLLKQFEAQKTKVNDKVKEELDKRDNLIYRLNGEYKKLEDTKSDFEKNLTKETQNKDKVETAFKSFKKIQTVMEFDSAKAVLENALANIYSGKIALQRPDFDIPKFGELYQEKNRFEYIVLEEEDFEKAESEMQAFGIQEVTFVSA